MGSLQSAPRRGEGIEPSNPGAARACRFGGGFSFGWARLGAVRFAEFGTRPGTWRAGEAGVCGRWREALPIVQRSHAVTDDNGCCSPVGDVCLRLALRLRSHARGEA